MSSLVRYDPASDAVVPAGAAGGLELYILFKVGSSDYALPAEQVIQLESFTGCTKVPGTAPYVAGLVQIRGRVMPLVDLRIRFGAPITEPTLDTRVVVGQRGDRIVGLLVDSARDVAKLAPGQVKPPPKVLADESAGFVRAVAQLGSRMVVVLDFAKVIGEEQLDGV